MLRALDAATRPEQLNALQGVDPLDDPGSRQLRITFGWDGPDAVAVDLEDYH
jgi:plasmid maintenance system killer protein